MAQSLVSQIPNGAGMAARLSDNEGQREPKAPDQGEYRTDLTGARRHPAAPALVAFGSSWAGRPTRSLRKVYGRPPLFAFQHLFPAEPKWLTATAFSRRAERQGGCEHGIYIRAEPEFTAGAPPKISMLMASVLGN